MEDQVLPENEAQAPPAEATGASTSLSSEAVRNSPEYRTLQEQNRALARQRGNAERAAAEARAEAERIRQENDERQQAAVQAEIKALLGDEGIADWQEFADLSASDPIAAAKKLADMRKRAAAPPPAPEVQQVTQQQQPPATPPPPRTLDAGSPLTSVADSSEAEYVRSLEERYGNVVTSNRDAANRVTDRDRAGGIMAYLEAGYRKAKTLGR